MSSMVVTMPTGCHERLQAAVTNLHLLVPAGAERHCPSHCGLVCLCSAKGNCFAYKLPVSKLLLQWPVFQQTQNGSIWPTMPAALLLLLTSSASHSHGMCAVLDMPPYAGTSNAVLPQEQLFCSSHVPWHHDCVSTVSICNICSWNTAQHQAPYILALAFLRPAGSS